MLTYIFTSQERKIFSDSESLPRFVNKHWHTILYNPFYGSMGIKINIMERWLKENKIYHFDLDNYSVVSRNNRRFNFLVSCSLALLYLGFERLPEIDNFRQKFISTDSLDLN